MSVKRLTEIRSGTPCIVLQQNTTDTWMLTEGKWKGSQAKFLYGEHAKVLRDVQDILRDDYDLDRLRELVKADREGRVKILAPAMLATCGSCTSFRRTPGTASGICEKREQFKVFQKRPCCKMYEAREDCE